MSDAEAADLYTLLLAGPLIAVLVLAIVLSVLHVLALNGRRVLPERIARVVGWFVFGLVIGLMTQLLSTDLIDLGHRRCDRRRDPLLGVERGQAEATPDWRWSAAHSRWLVNIGLFMVLLPSDPLFAVVDIRFPIVVGALVVAGIGVLLIIAAPRTAPMRKLTPIRRAMLLPNAIERAQAMGPVPAPLVLAFVAGMTGTIVVLLLGRSLDPVLLQLIVGAVVHRPEPRNLVDRHDRVA